MPFFRGNIQLNKNQIPANIMTHQKIATLQVRKSPQIKKILEKRVLPFTSLPLCASLTIEAALTLPLFLFLVVCLMMPMKMMDTQRKVQAVLESVAEDASRYAYLLYLAEDGGQEPIPEEEAWKSEALRFFAGAGVCGYAKSTIENKVASKALTDISFYRSRILEDQETIDLVMSYSIKLPFPILRIASVPMEARSCRRAWIGKDGGRGGGDAETEEDEIVYIGKTSSRYHKSRTCHYLYNNISSASYETIQEYRNSSGGKYYPCSRCGTSAASGSTVYFMPEGSSYHTDQGCSAIIAFVQAVKLSAVKHLGACSYCSK